MYRLRLFGIAVMLSLVAAPLVRAQVEDDTPIDVRATSLKIQSLLQRKDFAGADKAFEAAVKANPESAQIAALRRNLSLANSQANRHKEALAHASAYVDFQLAAVSKNPNLAASIPAAVDSLLYIARKAGQPEAGETKVDEAVAALAALHEKKPENSLASLLAQLQGAKVAHLAESKQPEKAAAILNLELAQARRNLALDKSNVGAIVALANLLNSQTDLLETTAPEMAPAAAKEFREFVARAAQNHSGEAEIVSLFLSAKTAEFYEVVQADPAAGEKVQAEFKAFFAHLEAANPGVKAIASRGAQLVSGMTRQIASSRAHAELVGKPATELDVTAWVNGPALSDKDLAGKVVLLDFWAVWCGPCIATFPHLRDWQEKYADKGLVILGMTRYYQYDWNQETAGIERAPGLTPEREQAAMLKFAEHHKLKHRFGVMPEGSEFSQSYGVQGIPQVVLIDRAGKVRLIRVGSGSRNAHDLEEAIKQALAAPAQ